MSLLMYARFCSLMAIMGTLGVPILLCQRKQAGNGVSERRLGPQQPALYAVALLEQRTQQDWHNLQLHARSSFTGDSLNLRGADVAGH